MAVQIIPLVAAIVGGAVAIGAGAYIYKNYKDSEQSVSPPAIVQPAKKPEAVPQPEVEVVKSRLPEFDLLRVEEDGSVVIAGTATPDSQIEIIHNEQILGNTKSAGNGDFVIVFDQSLKPGDYELYIRTISKDGSAVLSAEAGIVSIPEGEGESLAMVSKPGEASKLIQVPKSEEKPAPEVAAKIEKKPELEIAAREEAKSAPVEEAESAPVEVVKVEEKPEVEVTAKAESPPVEVAKMESDPVPEAKVVPEPRPENNASVEESNPVQVTEIKKQPTPEPKVLKPVFLEAVEVEGEKVFVAGTGEPGRVINIYIDERFMGNAKVNSRGIFLVESNSTLGFGSHTVRADMLGDGTAVVVARAEVPLIHDKPPEPVIVAKAPEAEEAKKEVRELKPVKTAESELVSEKATGQKTEPVKVAEPEAKSVKTAEPESKSAEVMKAAKEPVNEVESKTVKIVEAEKAPAKPVKTVEADQKSVEIAKLEDKSKQAGTSETKVTRNLVKGDKTKPVSENVEAPKQEVAVLALPKTVEAKTPETVPVAKEISKPEPAVVAKPKRVIRTGSSVIIRRGDNLWRISQRILGRGIRYSTIYQANRDQIRDPDLIYPGQIFKVPEKMVDVNRADES